MIFIVYRDIKLKIHASQNFGFQNNKYHFSTNTFLELWRYAKKSHYDNNIVRYIPLTLQSYSGWLGFLLGLTAALMLFYPELPEFLFGTVDMKLSKSLRCR